MAAHLPGWRQVGPKTARQWVGPNGGEPISRRQYDKLRREQGTLAPKEAGTPLDSYRRMVNDYAARHGIAPYKARSVDEFRLAYRTIRQSHAKERAVAREIKEQGQTRKRGVDVSWNGEYAQALVTLGLRSPDDRHDVGTTKRKGKK